MFWGLGLGGLRGLGYFGFRVFRGLGEGSGCLGGGGFRILGFSG